MIIIMVVGKCWEPGCEYDDPEFPVPTEDEQLRKLQQHVESEHPVDSISDVNVKDGSDCNHSP